MGCKVSIPSVKPSKEKKEESASSLCRDRKRLIKKVIKRRQTFAEAHSNYLNSLSSVSAAIALFVARQSQPLTVFSDSTPAAASTTQSQSGAEGDTNEVVCEHFFEDVNTEEQKSDLWDYFDVLDYSGNNNNDTSSTTENTSTNLETTSAAAVEGQKVSKEKDINKKSSAEAKTTQGENIKDEKKEEKKEFLDGLKEVAEQFLRAHQNGLELSRMLEVDRKPSQIPLYTINEICISKRSILSRFPSSKSLLSSSSLSETRGDRKSLLSSCSDTSSTCTESISDGVESSWGMVSGSHSFTLGRLCAWEKKLYDEVKVVNQTTKIFKQKRSHLLKKDLEGDDLNPSKANSEVTDLYHQLRVSIQRVESISKQIEKIRDEELLPQLVELIHGLMRTWKALMDSHVIQKRIIREVSAFSSPPHGTVVNNAQRLATQQLEVVIQKWHYCFSEYISAQKSYVKSLLGWLSKFVDAETAHYYKGQSTIPQIRFNGPTVMVTCQSWLNSLESLPDKSVKYAIKNLAKNVRALWVQQGEEQQRKRKMDNLFSEIDDKILTLKKAEDKALIMENMAHGNSKVHVKSEKTNQLEMTRKKYEMEKEKYHSCLQQRGRLMTNCLRRGFCSVFDSMEEFYSASVKVYANLVTVSQKAMSDKPA